MVVPRNFHLFLRSEEFDLLHWIGVQAILQRAQPEILYLYYQKEPKGALWTRVRTLPRVVVEELPLIDECAQLEKLFHRGGVCLDPDLIVLQSFDTLLQTDKELTLTVTPEGRPSISEMVIAPAGTKLLQGEEDPEKTELLPSEEFYPNSQYDQTLFAPKVARDLTKGYTLKIWRTEARSVNLLPQTEEDLRKETPFNRCFEKEIRSLQVEGVDLSRVELAWKLLRATPEERVQLERSLSPDQRELMTKLFAPNLRPEKKNEKAEFPLFRGGFWSVVFDMINHNYPGGVVFRRGPVSPRVAEQVSKVRDRTGEWDFVLIESEKALDEEVTVMPPGIRYQGCYLYVLNQYSALKALVWLHRLLPSIEVISLDTLDQFLNLSEELRKDFKVYALID